MKGRRKRDRIFVLSGPVGDFPSSKFFRSVNASYLLE